MSDSELYVDEDSKKLSDAFETIKEVCARNGWPLAALVLADDGKDSIVVTSAVSLQPKHKEEFKHIPQLGAAMFHCVTIITAGLNGKLPDVMIGAMEHAT